MFGLANDKLNQTYLEAYVNEYGLVSENHLNRMMRNAGFDVKKCSRFQNALRGFGTVNYDKAAKAYYSSSHVASDSGREYAMERIQLVLLDFLGKIEQHFKISSDFAPALVCMMLENRAYELVYAPGGKEPYLANQLQASRLELLYRAESNFFAPIVEEDDKAVINATKYIVLMEDITKAHIIQSKQVAYFCDLDEDNMPRFYTPGELQDGRAAG